jgi:hypothetical protein
MIELRSHPQCNPSGPLTIMQETDNELNERAYSCKTLKGHERVSKEVTSAQKLQVYLNRTDVSFSTISRLDRVLVICTACLQTVNFLQLNFTAHLISTTSAALGYMSSSRSRTAPSP